MSLWAAKAALRARGDAKGWIFPRYASDGTIRGTSTSGTINKWFRATLKIDKTTHSFRHAMRDRLREADADEEVQDVIGGWSSNGSVGRGYGKGHSLVKLKDGLDKVALYFET